MVYTSTSAIQAFAEITNYLCNRDHIEIGH